MAVAPGGFAPGVAGITAPGGAFTYQNNSAQQYYFAGTFFIDTGYDDPVTWAAGQPIVEIYGARVYGASGVLSPSITPGSYAGVWSITATPVWQSAFYASPASNANGFRIAIRCDCYCAWPINEASNAYQRLDSVDWSLYRL